MASSRLEPRKKTEAELAQDALKAKIAAVLWKIEELEATVTDFNGDQALLQERIQAYSKALETLYSDTTAAEVDVPLDVVKHLDEGGHPDAWTAEVFRRVRHSNQLVKGKGTDLRSLRNNLLQGLGEAYPEETAAYKAAAAATAEATEQP
ncbi:hypothetical protein WJX73_001946 [Symbiochloris irregularis]|uniref:Mediator of RNA polymerase II transcription subunit 10 n=1 Tax=Symbiochloris irregularis TaxID=706552 RepID=A0AAW1PV39_9CHLO